MRRMLLLGMLLLAAVQTGGYGQQGAWRDARPIQLPTLSAPQQVYLPLDEATLAEVTTVSEFRIIRSNTVETPYRMIEERGQTVEYALDSRVISQSPLDSNPEEILLDVGARPPSRLRIVLNLKGQDFRCRVWVDGSRNQVRWRPLLKQGSVFRQSGGTEQKELGIPSCDDRFLRLRLFLLHGTLPRIESIQVESQVYIARRLLLVPATLSRRERTDERRTELEIKPGLLTRDLVEARFEVAEGAFDRAVTVEALQRNNEWLPYPISGTLKRLALDSDVTLPLDISEARRLRFFIYNGDDRPLTIRKVTLWRARRGLIFSAEPGQQYELWYGCPNALAPHYDLERLPLTTSPVELSLASSGPRRLLPPPPPERMPPPPWSEQHPFMFWAALGIVLALLLLLIVRSMRGMKGGVPRPHED